MGNNGETDHGNERLQDLRGSGYSITGIMPNICLPFRLPHLDNKVSRNEKKDENYM